jgi:gentisate 1,2-dioxygenase
VGIELKKQFFSNHGQVFDDLKETGFWPTTFISGPSPGLDSHWHSEDVHAYVMEGDTWFADETGERHPIGAGDKLVIPARTLHAEGEILDRVVYLIALPKPIHATSEEFLRQHPPEEL